MKIITDEKLIKRNATIGNVLNVAALAILFAGLYITFVKPQLQNYALFALVIGFFLMQIGTYFRNRWGRTPRTDTLLTQALKGLGGKYSLYHFTTPASHLLVGPAGIWVLIPKYAKGRIVYEKKRWRAKGGGFIEAYMKLFGQDNLGRPDLEINSETDAMQKYLKKLLPEETNIPQVQAVVVLVHPDAKPDADTAPNPTVHIKKLRNYFQNKTKSDHLSQEMIVKINRALER